MCKRCRDDDDSNDRGFYCKYDGPNDIDRYEGHGVWDESDGYWCY